MSIFSTVNDRDNGCLKFLGDTESKLLSMTKNGIPEDMVFGWDLDGRCLDP